MYPTTPSEVLLSTSPMASTWPNPAVSSQSCCHWSSPQHFTVWHSVPLKHSFCLISTSAVVLFFSNLLGHYFLVSSASSCCPPRPFTVGATNPVSILVSLCTHRPGHLMGLITFSPIGMPLIPKPIPRAWNSNANCLHNTSSLEQTAQIHHV